MGQWAGRLAQRLPGSAQRHLHADGEARARGLGTHLAMCHLRHLPDTLLAPRAILTHARPSRSQPKTPLCRHPLPLIPQHTEREILWPLQKAIRRGWKRDEVEKPQASIEDVCEAGSVGDVGRGMPCVADVERLPEEDKA